MVNTSNEPQPKTRIYKPIENNSPCQHQNRITGGYTNQQGNKTVKIKREYITTNT